VSTILTRTCISVAFGALAAIGQQCALSAEPHARANSDEREPIAFVFRYKPSDLTSSEGAKNVYLDLKSKAGRACKIKDAPGSRVRRIDQQCVSELMTSVVQQVASGALSEQHSHTLVAASMRGGRPSHAAN
jgi:UrcA family protein